MLDSENPVDRFSCNKGHMIMEFIAISNSCFNISPEFL